MGGWSRRRRRHDNPMLNRHAPAAGRATAAPRGIDAVIDPLPPLEPGPRLGPHDRAVGTPRSRSYRRFTVFYGGVADTTAGSTRGSPTRRRRSKLPKVSEAVNLRQGSRGLAVRRRAVDRFTPVGEGCSGCRRGFASRDRDSDHGRPRSSPRRRSGGARSMTPIPLGARQGYRVAMVGTSGWVVSEPIAWRPADASSEKPRAAR
jgi:hypothetical protein